MWGARRKRRAWARLRLARLELAAGGCFSGPMAKKCLALYFLGPEKLATGPTWGKFWARVILGLKRLEVTESGPILGPYLGQLAKLEKSAQYGTFFVEGRNFFHFFVSFFSLEKTEIETLDVSMVGPRLEGTNFIY